MTLKTNLFAAVIAIAMTALTFQQLITIPASVSAPVVTHQLLA
ncbi:hypothetical protein [Tsuneonella mangrovi]|nr:hypothetical protein [Tsuneonella mangrovi]